MSAFVGGGATLTLSIYDHFGGIFASQVIRLFGNVYSQLNAYLYLWGTSGLVSK